MIGRGLGTAATVVAIDQLSKYIVLQSFDATGCIAGGSPLHPVIKSFFNLVLTCNRGMSFGLFNSSAGLSVPFFTIAAAAIVAILIFWLSRVHSDMLATAIGLIIGGALGNIVDRLRFGGVIDFLSFHIPFEWPAFNLADSAICIGVTIMLLEGLLGQRFSSQPNQGEDPLP
jgi:signal peptidase II